MDPSEDEDFNQDYVLGKTQNLYIYCRLCRTTFPVSFKPKSRRIRLRCLCGHEAPLGALDVFRSDEEAREHATFYQKVYRAAKNALIDAGLSMPPSGKYVKVEDVENDSDFSSVYSETEDESAIRDGYIPEDESAVSEEIIKATIADFDERLDGVRDMVLRHEILTELLEWTYCRRYFHDTARQRFREACVEDIRIAKRVAREAARRKKAGDPVRVTFSSFKHLAIDFEDDGEHERALEVVLKAHELGLKGYAARAEALRRRIDEGSM